MEKILIEGSSDQVQTLLKEQIREGWKLRYVTVFFLNTNFLITKYKPKTNGVHLILELEDQTEIHVEAANCGYGGQGPHATIDALELFGLDGEEARKLVFYHDAVYFEVRNGKILAGTINTYFLFYPSIREKEEPSLYNRIKNDSNVSAELEKGRVLIYNPQRTCWNGFLNLISYMNDIEMAYYLGNHSPLENQIHFGHETRYALMHHKGADVIGIKHVNLLLSGSNFRIACAIDREYELEVIEAVYLALTGKCLFPNEAYDPLRSRRSLLLKALKDFYRTLTYNRREISGNM